MSLSSQPGPPTYESSQGRARKTYRCLDEVSAFHGRTLPAPGAAALPQPAGLEHIRMIFERPVPPPTLAGPGNCLKNAPMQSPSSLVDVHALSVPAGVLHTPVEADHIIDIHVGEPVRVSCRLDG